MVTFIAGCHVVVTYTSASIGVPRSCEAFLWFAGTHADRLVPHHFMVVLNGTLLGSALALASLTVPELRNGVVQTIADLWSWSAFASAVICIPILFRAAVLALVTFAFTVSVAPTHVSRASARVHALAVADLLIPHIADRAV